jgi:hypothetical protein
MLLARELPGELSRLAVVSCQALQPLTTTHARHVTRLVDWLQAEQVLRHPLLVTSLRQRTVVLDGNARLAAANKMGIPDLLVQQIPAQLVPDPLKLPAMAVLGITTEEIYRILDEGFVSATEAPRESLAVYLRGGDIRTLIPDGIQPQAVWESYRRIIAAMHTVADVVPLANTAASRNRDYWPNDTVALVTPPPLHRDVLAHMVSHNRLLPSGALQAPIPRRILGINLSLKVLQAGEPIEEKTAFVRELVRLRMSEQRVHYYDAPVYIFET